MAEEPIKVFISYSWDSKEHKDKVYHLAQALRDDGIDCTIDQFVQSPDNWDRWMLDQIDESDFVLIVCTERYYRRYRGKEEVNKGLGVTWESTLIIGRLHDSQGRNPKFYPIFFDTPNLSIIPDGIRTSYFDLSGYDLFNLDNNEQRLKEGGGYQDLYRLLTDQPSAIPRKLGSLKKLETVDRETEQQEAKAAEQQRLLAQQRQEGETVDRETKADDDLTSDRFGANYYAKLRDLLKDQDWKAADQATADRMLRVMDRFKESWLDVEHIQKFPCQDLRAIDQLWVKYSQGKFGFSVQKKIYVECGAKLDGNYPGDKIWEKFGDRVGWRKNGKWLGYSELHPSLSSPQGIFPAMAVCSFGWGWVLVLGLVSSLSRRLVDCNR
ncbi:GUN4 domain-containing protein [Leptodesmis sichuanensis]|uniref:GUN4 domain-containing protein n=1 Tax=Leptodesmis sichuanensis TaxID=2906798 RepID=UPI001F3E994A|nr:GUN4 domain-containing protein [Leptodesmis sichuanensis]UIE39458.1 GUN4 domain-containing protein [Leptodesmis sichuanensis A121]